MRHQSQIFKTLLISGFYLAHAVTVVPTFALAETVPSLSRVMGELNKSEQELVADAIKNQLGEDERELAEDIIRRGKKIPEIARQISQGDYTSFGNAFAAATSERLQEEIETRYPEGSTMRRTLDSVRDNTALYEKLAKAALNADPDMAATALQDALEDYAKTKIGDLRNEGVEFWKDLYRSLLPGSQAARRAGIDPASIYAKAVQDMADLSRRANRELDVFVFDCLHLRYRKLVRDGTSRSDALESISGTALSDPTFNCAAERALGKPGGIDPGDLGAMDSVLLAPGRALDEAKKFAQGRARGGSTFAKWDTELEEIANLIRVYEDELQAGRIKNTNFADWLEKRLWDEFKRRSVELNKGLESDHAEVQEALADRLRIIASSLISQLPRILKQTLGEERFRTLAELPEKDTIPTPEEIAEATKKSEEISDEDKRYDEMMKELEKRACDPVQRKTPTADKDGFVPVTKDYGGPYELPPGCEPYGLAQRFEYEGQELSGLDKNDKEPPRESADKDTSCARLAASIEAAGSLYRDGAIEAAKATLEDLRLKLDAATGTEACPDLTERVSRNLARISRFTTVVNEIEESLIACEPATLRLHYQRVNGANHVKLVSLREQLMRAIPVAENYSLGKAAHKQGRIDEAGALFKRTLERAKESHQPTCADIESRTLRNLARIDQAKDLEKLASDSLERCDLAAMQKQRAQLVGATNPFLIALHARLRDLPARCAKLSADANCASTFGEDWTSGPPDDKGSYYCKPPYQEAANRWCEDHNDGSGWTAGTIGANGSFGCFPSYSRQRNAALSDCRRQHGRRLIRVYRVSGQWYCRYRQKKIGRNTATPRTNRTRRQPSGYDPRAAAAAAAITGALIQGLARPRGGGHQHGRGRNCAADPRAPGC